MAKSNHFRFCLVVAVWLSWSPLLASCGGQKAESRAIPDTALTIHAAALDPVDGWNKMQFRDASQGEIWVEPAPALTLADIKSGKPTRDELARPGISIQFTSAGSERVRKFSREHIGKMAAIIFDGKVLNAPVIRSEISSNAMISTGPAGFSEEEIQQILAVINR